jgi:hypothetical protein
MKLIKVKTKLTSTELFSVFENVSIEELEVILNMSKYFDYIDVTYSDEKSGFFAIMADSYKQKIEDFFQKHSIGYKLYDLSKDVYFDNPIEIRFTNENKQDISHQLKDLVFKFKKNHTTIDDVLDKINEKGINSLTNFDKSILK